MSIVGPGNWSARFLDGFILPLPSLEGVEDDGADVVAHDILPEAGLGGGVDYHRMPEQFFMVWNPPLTLWEFYLFTGGRAMALC